MTIWKSVLYTLLLLYQSTVGVDASLSGNPLAEALENTWKGIKQRNIDPYRIKCVHRPFSETPDDCVSEGIGYGMIVAVYSNDQEYFDMIWDSAETYMWNSECYDWRINVMGFKTDRGAATDAEQDIAFALISAQHLVNKGVWNPHPEHIPYEERAQDILDNMWDTGMISPHNNIAPGAGWGGDDFVNPGYFAPAWYRIFREFDTSPNHNWTAVIDRCYDTLLNNVGAHYGMVPDWTSPDGQFYDQSLGYNAYGEGRYMYKDGIRVLWRIGTDYAWYGDPRAQSFLEKSYAFLSSKGGAPACNFYQMNGDLVPEGDEWTFGGGNRHRPRREHSPLTIGMWSIVPFVLTKTDVAEYGNELLSFYEPDALYWGHTNGTRQKEDIHHNELYFDQFLAWFGGIVLNNTWVPL